MENYEPSPAKWSVTTGHPKESIVAAESPEGCILPSSTRQSQGARRSAVITRWLGECLGWVVRETHQIAAVRKN